MNHRRFSTQTHQTVSIAHKSQMDSCLMTMYSLPFLFISLFIFKVFYQRKHYDCYILDYQCYKPSDDRMLNMEIYEDVLKRNKNLGLDEYKFLLKTIVSSGIGEEAYGPRIIFSGQEEHPTCEDSIQEMDEFFFDSIDKLLKRAQVAPSEIDVLVVDVSMLASVPSLSSRIVNRYKMRDNIKSYNLSGMGCSASLTSINLVQNIFKSQKNMYALVVTSESLSSRWYTGNEKSMLLSNCLFRSGGCAILLTNKIELKHKVMLKLKCLVGTHHGGKDESYNCCIQQEDFEGKLGFFLGKNLPKVATKVFIDNVKEIFPKILPVKEILRFALLSFRMKFFRGSKKLGTKPMVNCKTGVDHFALHTGGKAVIDAIGQNLGLSEYDLEPTRMALHRFGNTSASGNWYALGYMEAKNRLKKGNKVFMISFGAGFMCNSCLWEVTRDLNGDGNIWKECNIENYTTKTLSNPFLEKYGWIQDKDIDTFNGLVQIQTRKVLE